MKKVAINLCYGGFNISAKAVARLADLQGRPCFFYKNESVFGKTPKESYTPVPCDEVKGLFWSAFDRDDVQEAMPYGVDIPTVNAWWHKHQLDSRPENREDPLLIQVIEELGEEASGSCAKVSIVEIPSDVEYTIEEYDGYEHVAEKHRKWPD